MLKNNGRYVARQGPLIALRCHILGFLTWQSPFKTIVGLVLWCLVCSYPNMLILIPMMVIGFISLNCYHERVQMLSRLPVNSQLVVEPLNAPHHIEMTTAKYKAHLQCIQNGMGAYCDLYDVLYYVYRTLDWSHPQKTKSVLMRSCLACVPLYLLWNGYLGPFSLWIMWIGLGLFFANSALVRAATLTLQPLVVNLASKLDPLHESDHEDTMTVALYENQRWWAGIGFIPLLLSMERGLWSDETGSISLPPKELYDIDSIPSQGQCTYKWSSEWGVELTSSTDENGWIYTDTAWHGPSPFVKLVSMTRRRKWIRSLKSHH